MPKAVATQETKRIDLRSCPGGFVVLRKFTYGEMLHRRDLGVSFSGQQDGGQQREVRAKMNSLAVQQFEFSTCIIEHNLEDEDGTILNFKTPGTIEKLDSQIAGEIETAITDMNEPPSEDSLRSFQPSST